MFNVRALYCGAVFEPEQILQKNFDRIRDPIEPGRAGFFKLGETENPVRPAAGSERSGSSEGVLGRHEYSHFSLREDDSRRVENDVVNLGNLTNPYQLLPVLIPQIYGAFSTYLK